MKNYLNKKNCVFIFAKSDFHKNKAHSHKDDNAKDIVKKIFLLLKE